MTRVLLGFAAADAASVTALAADVGSVGYVVIDDLASSAIADDGEWSRRLDAIARADVVMPVVSRAWRASPRCRAEADWAVRVGRPLVVIELGGIDEHADADALPPALAAAARVPYDAKVRGSVLSLASALLTAATTPAGATSVDPTADSGTANGATGTGAIDAALRPPRPPADRPPEATPARGGGHGPEPTTTEPTTTEPTITEPTTTGPVTTGPVTTGPVTTGPLIARPASYVPGPARPSDPREVDDRRRNTAEPRPARPARPASVAGAARVASGRDAWTSRIGPRAAVSRRRAWRWLRIAIGLVVGGLVIDAIAGSNTPPSGSPPPLATAASVVGFVMIIAGLIALSRFPFARRSAAHEVLRHLGWTDLRAGSVVLRTPAAFDLWRDRQAIIRQARARFIQPMSSE